MLRDEDEFDPEYECPECGHTFHSHARLGVHLAEHEGPRKCKQCGEKIPGDYHRCR